jgi:DDE superfamily endonuclease
VRSSPQSAKEVIEVRTLPKEIIRLSEPFAPLFSKKRVFQHALVLLLAGAILAQAEADCELRSARWAFGPTEAIPSLPPGSQPRQLVQPRSEPHLLGLPVEVFAPEGPLVLGIDETLERRWGKKIAARGV